MKQHIKKHKEAYIVGLTSLAVITCLIMRKNPKLLSGSGSSLLSGLDASSLSFKTVFGNVSGNSVTTIHTGTKGHPGFVTRCVDTNQLFLTQGDAARNFNIPESILSSHLNGKFDNACGYHFERLGIFE